jgi:hypothetical protein
MSLNVVTVEDVLSAAAEFDHVVEVRSIGPAVVLVLEKDAPLRMNLLASTESERQALRDECRSNPMWGEILDTWFACKSDEDDFDFGREDEHADRLDNGRRLDTLRVTERVT